MVVTVAVADVFMVGTRGSCYADVRFVAVTYASMYDVGTVVGLHISVNDIFLINMLSS